MSLEDELAQHCFGADEPATLLLQTGRLPDRWVERYLDLLDRAFSEWGNHRPVPRAAVAAIHFASTYLHLRYWSWTQKTYGENKVTDEALARIRTRSEMWLLGPLNPGPSVN